MKSLLRSTALGGSDTLSCHDPALRQSCRVSEGDSGAWQALLQQRYVARPKRMLMPMSMPVLPAAATATRSFCAPPAARAPRAA